MKIVYSPKYDVDIGEHVFLTQKYKLVYQKLIESGEFKEEDFIEPQAADKETVELVHTPRYVKKMQEGSLTPFDIMRLELPYSKELAEASFICCGGSIKAAQIALKEGVCIHLGGGFHHAYPDWGEGFCVFNDVAVAIRKLQKDNLIKTAVVIDCDLHQGNGTARIFKNDDSVFTFSIHQEDNYPLYKEESDLDVGLERGVDDEEYLKILQESFEKIFKDNRNFDLIAYIAGADIYKEDMLGNLSLSIEGIKKRDEFVFKYAKEKNICIFVTFGGGYAQKKEDLIEIHVNTIKTAKQIFSR